MQHRRSRVASTLVSAILTLSAATATAQTTAIIADGETREETTENTLPDSVVIESGGTLDLKASQSIDSLNLENGGLVELKNSITLTIGDNDGDSQIDGDIRAVQVDADIGGSLELAGSGTFDINADLSPITFTISGDQTTVNFNKTDSLSFGTPGFNVTGKATINLNAEDVFTQEGARSLSLDPTTNQAIDFNIQEDNLVSGDSSVGSKFETGHATVINIEDGKTLQFDGLYFDHNGALAGNGHLVINNPNTPSANLGSSSAASSTHTGNVRISNTNTYFIIEEGSLAASKALSFNNAGMEGTLASLPEIKSGALNQSLDLYLNESHVRFDDGATHQIDQLTLDAESTVEIVSGAALSIGHSAGVSSIDGTVKGPGSLAIASTSKSTSNTTVESAGQITNGLTVGNAITLINNGTISRNDKTLATEVNDSGNVIAHDLKITNAGTIEATVNNDALYLRDSDRAEITNSGTIEADGSTGINLKLSDRADIRNSGDILAGDNNGIFIEDSTNAYIENSGTIRAGTDDGIDLENSKDAEVVNLGAGTIQANNNDAVLLKNSERASVTNAGTIKALGATGLHIGDADQASIINSGNIIAGTNNGLYGERSTNSYIENSGKIEAGSDDGIDLEDSSNARVINSGTISAAGNVGINLIGSTNAQVTNSGTISATDNNGILLRGSTGARIENTGLISANRNAVDASDPDTVVNATIINSGVLRTQSETVELNGNHVLRNSGTIEATGAGETAIRAGADGGAVVILEKGSKIIGDISSGSADNTLRINVGSAQSVMYDTTGDWTLESLDGRPVVDGSVMAAGIGNLETVDERMHRHSVDLRNSISRLAGQRIMAPGAPILVDVYSGEETRHAGDGENGAGLLPAYNLDTAGLTLATDLGNPEHHIRLFINYTNDELNIDDDTHRIDSQGIRIGASTEALFTIGELDIGGRIAIGRNEYEGDREVLINTIGSSGVTRQQAEWESNTWDVAINARYRDALSEATTFTLSPELAIQGERIDGYKESAQFDWDKRNVRQGRASLQAALEHQASEQTRLSAALSVWHREIIDGRTADYTLAGTRVSYTDPQYDGQGVSARLGFEHQVSEAITLAATVAGYGTAEQTDGWAFGVSLLSQF